MYEESEGMPQREAEKNYSDMMEGGEGGGV